MNKRSWVQFLTTHNFSGIPDVLKICYLSSQCELKSTAVLPKVIGDVILSIIQYALNCIL